MLTIRQKQLKALVEAPREAYFRRLEQNARHLFPARAATLGDVETRALVRRVAEAAESGGFDTEVDVAQVVNLYFLLGPDFEDDAEMAWVMDILGDTTRPARERVEATYARLAEVRGANRS